ncbi:hypothetical protein IWQ60_007859 [Tieghemiomyces parasiticus]|uniref:RING-type E3 ubiquitin transferase n=1 Tax=Tieghemiomyces parasiticus TaxID=78921 RepID=A0A9W8A0C6_9FUNG|nr:hypothetical protein IWQ60_007859 [Tieghemiomyces parasiticus]
MSDQLPATVAAESETTPAADDSGDRCAICLDGWERSAFIDGCFHAFCLPCIVQWCEHDPRCPLCKRPIHTVVYDVEGRYHRTWTVTTSRQAALTDGTGRPRPSRPPGATASRRYRYAFGQPTGFTEAQALRKRQTVYGHGLVPRRSAVPRSGAVQAARGRGGSHEPFELGRQVDPDRIRRWVAREVRVILGDENPLVVYEYVMALLHRPVDLGSSEIREELRPFFHEYTDTFLRELQAFSNSHLSIDFYDRYVAYGPPGQSRNESP